ncbi:hypothetical protein J31TS4_34430 [Paenibacillus sp. J31TS4]|nr:hypothetical protein [Paenibacillus sp. J31TS4]GIP40163.1 hypothetical protein J31TS4_34430 [Paenibacillus sp. J31TS4]
MKRIRWAAAVLLMLGVGLSFFPPERAFACSCAEAGVQENCV